MTNIQARMISMAMLTIGFSILYTFTQYGGYGVFCLAGVVGVGIEFMRSFVEDDRAKNKMQ